MDYRIRVMQKPLTALCRWRQLGLLILMVSSGSCDNHSDGFDNYPSDLLTDKELQIPPDSGAPPENAVWSAWIKTNAAPVRSLTSSHFNDLDCLKTYFQGKRIVLLGESGHGVAQFSMAKVRLIKFLHEQCDFGVIAFESGLYDCFSANTNVLKETPLMNMKRSVFPVWHTEELLPLFEYLKETRTSSRPLDVAGFDIQMSSTYSYFGRAYDYKRIIQPLDAVYADAVYRQDSMFTQGADIGYLISNQNTIKQFYDTLYQFLETGKTALQSLHPQESGLIRVLTQEAHMTPAAVDLFVLQAQQNYQAASVIRDRSMAENIDFLIDTLFPGKKIIVWAHNAHVCNRYDEVIGSDYAFKNMGHWLSDNHRAEMYTVGFYIYRGRAATNHRVVYDISPATSGSLESIFYRSDRRFCFLDISRKKLSEGNAWLFNPITAKSWGLNAEQMILIHQYDGLFFIYEVTPPSYL